MTAADGAQMRERADGVAQHLQDVTREDDVVLAFQLP